MRKYVLALAALAMIFGFAPSALAEKPSETGNQNRPCEQVPDHPHCVDGVFLPPGLGGPNPGCENAKPGKNPNCPPDNGGTEPPAEEGCPPGGPVTDILLQVTDGIRDGGGGALADPLEDIICAVHDLTGL